MLPMDAALHRKGKGERKGLATYLSKVVTLVYGMGYLLKAPLSSFILSSRLASCGLYKERKSAIVMSGLPRGLSSPPSVINYSGRLVARLVVSALP